MTEFKIFDEATIDSKNIRFIVFCDEQGVEKSHEIDDLDMPKKAKHIVMYENSKPVATSRFYKESGNTWHAGRIAVLKEMRGTKKLGAKEIFISAQTQARGFYESLGYKAYGNVYPEENIPHIAMKKKI